MEEIVDLHQKLLLERDAIKERGGEAPVPSARDLHLLRQYARRGVHNKGDAVTRAKLMTKYPMIDAEIKAKVEKRGNTLAGCCDKK